MKAISLLAFSASAYALAFDGPAPTPVDPHALLRGFSAKPTAKPRAIPDMFRRQTSEDNGMCGYLQGDAELPISCTAGACNYDTSLSWFGCCSGTAATDCDLATSCIPSVSVSSCLGDAICSADNYLIACTESSAPFCGVLYSTQLDNNVVSHLLCVATETSVEVLATTVGGGVASSVRVNNTPRPSPTDETDLTTTARTSSPARSTVGGGGNMPGNSPATARSSAGAAIQTAAALAGVAAGGFAGVFALLF